MPASSESNPRSTTEKLLVRGGIVILLLLVAFQAHAKLGKSKSYKALSDRVSLDEGPNAKPLLIADIDQYIVGWPSRTVVPHSDLEARLELSWLGLTGRHEFVVGYDPSEQGGTVIYVEPKGDDDDDTAKPEPLKSTVAPAPASEDGESGQPSNGEPAAGE
mgnify:CR=1 FL=1